MGKHSNGPWLAVDVLTETNGYQSFAIVCANQPCNNQNDIAAIWPRGGKAKTQANAALIAAAPEMLKALERIVSDAGKFYSKHNVEELSECILIARYAIATATGEQP